MDIDWYIRNDALARLGRRHVSGREALAGLTHLPALVTLFAATKLKHLHVHVSIKGTLTRDQAQRRLAFAFIGAAALIQASHAEWAIGVASETVLLLLAARYLAAERNAASFPNLGAFGAIFRWLAMSSDPSLVPLFPAGNAWSKFRCDLFWERAAARRHCTGNAQGKDAGLARVCFGIEFGARNLRIRLADTPFWRKELSCHGCSCHGRPCARAHCGSHEATNWDVIVDYRHPQSSRDGG
jgi:hypothetical protein